MKRPTTNGDEYDVTTGWRYAVKGYEKAGVTSRIKRGMRRRERHQARREFVGVDWHYEAKIMATLAIPNEDC